MMLAFCLIFARPSKADGALRTNIQGEADARASGAQADEKERGKTRAESARAPPRREL